MEKIPFTSPETGEEIELYVIEQTVLGGEEYLLAADQDAEEAEAYILRRTFDDAENEAGYEFVSDDAELEALMKVFGELVEDTDFRIQE